MRNSKPKIHLLALATIASLSTLGFSRQAMADTFVYSAPNTTTDVWSTGADWTDTTTSTTPAAPASGTATVLTFVAANSTTVVADNLNNSSNNDITGGGTGGAFQLNILNLGGKGPATASSPATISITGNDLEFVVNGATNPVVNLYATVGTSALTYNINNNLILTNSTTFRIPTSSSGGSTLNLKGNITGAGNLTLENIVSGGGLSENIVLSGTNTFGGNIFLNSGNATAHPVSLQINSSAALPTTATVTFTGLSSNFNLFNSDSFTLVNPLVSGVAGQGTVKYFGSGNLTINADNSNFTGSFIVGPNVTGYTGTPGTLTIGNNNALGKGTINLYNTNDLVHFATLATSTDIILSNNVNVGVNSGSQQSAFAAIAGTGNLTITGIFNSGANSQTTVQNNIDAGKSLNFNGEFKTPSGTNTLNLNGAGSSIINGQITGTGSVRYQGTGTLTITGTNSTYTGITTIKSGTVKIASINTLGSNSSLGAPTTPANGTIALGDSATTGTLVYTGTGSTTDRVINLPATAAGGGIIDQSGTGLLKFTATAFTATGTSKKTLTLQGSTAGTGEIAAAIVNNNSSNTTSLTKAGTGTWTLSGTNSYTGATTVNGGTLLVNGSITSATTVNSNATLGGSGTIAGTVELKSGSILSPGNSPGQLSVNTLKLDAGSTTHMEIAGATLGTQYDNATIVTASALTYAGTLEVVSLGGYDLSAQDGSYTLFSFTGTPAGDLGAVSVDSIPLTDNSGVWSGTNGNANYTFTDSTGILAITATAVPEPASLALLAFGAAALLTRRKR